MGESWALNNTCYASTASDIFIQCCDLTYPYVKSCDGEYRSFGLDTTTSSNIPYLTQSCTSPTELVIGCGGYSII